MTGYRRVQTNCGSMAVAGIGTDINLRPDILNGYKLTAVSGTSCLYLSEPVVDWGSCTGMQYHVDANDRGYREPKNLGWDLDLLCRRAADLLGHALEGCLSWTASLASCYK